MSIYHRNEFSPRNGHTLVVGVVARISGCPRQKELSLDDQFDHAKQTITELYSGPVKFEVIATKGKGERLDRPELVKIEELLRTRQVDVLFAEDIGRMVRGTAAGRLCGIAVDMGTRVLAPNDCIDTGDPDWEEDVIQACRDHVGHNAHTSKRIKQKKMNRFVKFGGATPCEIAGYVKPAGAKTFDDWKIDESATSIIQEGLQRLKVTLNCCVVADYFNSVGFLPGKYCRSKVWDGRMVRRYYCNSLLSGRPSRGHRHTVKHNESGRRVSVVNPKGPVYIEEPHLAHISASEQDEVNSELERKNKMLGRAKVHGIDPRWRVPKKNTSFPSQHARCYYCGCHYVRGANGITNSIMCSNSREWHCWNSIGVDCEMSARRVIAAITDALYSLDAFDLQFRDLVTQAYHRQQGNSTEAWQKLERSEAQLERDTRNVVDAIAEYGPRPEIAQKLTELKQTELRLASERHFMETHRSRQLHLPPTVSELRNEFEKKSEGLAIESPSFGTLLWSLVPEFHIYLVRLLDGGHLLPRARIKLNLAAAACTSDLMDVPGLSSLLTSVVTLDLFVPPQREHIREAAARLAATGATQREIADRVSEPTHQVVVQKALELQRMMKERGVVSPYEMLDEPPTDYPKLRRYQNHRYEFKMLDGYEPPPV